MFQNHCEINPTTTYQKLAFYYTYTNIKDQLHTHFLSLKKNVKALSVSKISHERLTKMTEKKIKMDSA